LFSKQLIFWKLWLTHLLEALALVHLLEAATHLLEALANSSSVALALIHLLSSTSLVFLFYTGLIPLFFFSSQLYNYKFDFFCYFFLCFIEKKTILISLITIFKI
jgi:hypothetical protein